MKILTDFLDRLEREGLCHYLQSLPRSRSIRVRVEAGSEIWHIDFCGNEVTVTVFRAQEQPGLPPDTLLEGLFGRQRKVWVEAAEDLGIEFESPFLILDERGAGHQCTGRLPHFGGAKGTLILSSSDAPELGALGDRMGFHMTALNPFHYWPYRRELFVDTLRDWGWFGPADRRPAWLDRSEGKN